jgi:DNA-repair protein complementing XP-A cells
MEDNVSKKCLQLWNGEACQNIGIDDEMLVHFEEHVCKRCKAYLEEFQLINKSQLQSEYLLPEDSIKLMLCLNRPNPRNENWIPMKMYLRKHAMTKALRRYGSKEALDLEIDKRKKLQYERSVQKTENIFTAKRSNACFHSTSLGTE